MQILKKILSIAAMISMVCVLNVHAYPEITLPQSTNQNDVINQSAALYNDEMDINEQDYYPILDKGVSDINFEASLSIAQQSANISGTGYSTYVDAIWQAKGQYFNVSPIALWESDNTDVVIAQQGRLIGVGKGTAMVTVKFRGKEASIQVTVDNLVASSASRVSGSYTSAQKPIMDKAKAMVNLTWRPTKNLMGWRGTKVFQAGVTYRGIPYSQTPHQEDNLSFPGTLSKAGFYTTFSNGGKTMPMYGNDCSGFVSYAWGIPRNNTSGFVAGIRSGRYAKVGSYNANAPSAADLKASYRRMHSGDAMVKVGHVILVESVQGTNVVCYEQTPAQAIVSTHSFDELASHGYMPFSRGSGGGNYASSGSGSGGGWVKSGNTWYYTSGGRNATGWRQIGGVWYYFGSNGAMATGWRQIGGVWYYFKSSGAMAANQWIGSRNPYYYVHSNGAMASSQWVGMKSGYYYFHHNGRMAYDAWIKGRDGYWYYVTGSGKMAANTSIYMKKYRKTYRFDVAGRCLNP